MKGDREPTQRCFLAAELPPSLVAALAGTQDRLRRAAGAAGARVAWVAPERMHITLRFLGEVGDDVVAAFVAWLERLPGADPSAWVPVTLQCRYLGAFPEGGSGSGGGRRRPPRVLWAGVEDEPPGVLAAWARRADERARGLGLDPEFRPFAPHVTLGRVRRPGRADALRAALAGERPGVGPERLPSLALFASDLPGSGGAPGVRYRVLQRLPLP